MQKIFKISKVAISILLSISIIMIFTSCGSFNDSTSNQEDTSTTKGLEISNTQGVNAQGVLTVTGDIKNISDQNFKSLVISVIFYNSSKEELTTVVDTSEDILLPDETYHFKVNCLKKDASIYDVEVKGYK